MEYKKRDSPEPHAPAKGWGLALYSAVGMKVILKDPENPELEGRTGKVVGVDGERLRVKFELPSGETPIVHVSPESLGIFQNA